MSKPARITAFISLCISITWFVIGAAAILILPGLAPEAQLLLPVVVLVSILAAPFAGARLTRWMAPGGNERRDGRISSGRTYPRGG